MFWRLRYFRILRIEMFMILFRMKHWQASVMLHLNRLFSLDCLYYTGSQALGLPWGCVLDAIQQAQMLDDLDIEGIFPLYQKVTSALEKEDISR